MNEPIITNLRQLNALYHSVNELLAVMGIEGYVDTKMPCTINVMSALKDIDGGEYNKDGKIFATNVIEID
jgi:hypothetical protein